jgi:hypothetical protein
MPYTLLVGKRLIVGAWAVELAALAAIALWVDAPWRAIDIAVGTVILPSLLCWLMPAGALLAHWRASRELRLPRAGRGRPAARTALSLGLNLLPATSLLYAVSQDHDWAVYKTCIVLCILLAELLLLLAPMVLLVSSVSFPRRTRCLVRAEHRLDQPDAHHRGPDGGGRRGAAAVALHPALPRPCHWRHRPGRQPAAPHGDVERHRHGSCPRHARRAGLHVAASARKAG